AMTLGNAAGYCRAAEPLFPAEATTTTPRLVAKLIAARTTAASEERPRLRLIMSAPFSVAYRIALAISKALPVPLSSKALNGMIIASGARAAMMPATIVAWPWPALLDSRNEAVD